MIAACDLFDPVVYFLDRIPSKLIWSDVLKISAFSRGLSFFATIIPARKVALKDPATILKNDRLYRN